MDWLNREKGRHNAIGGSYSGAMAHQTRNQVLSKFKQSVTYKEVIIDNKIYETRMVSEKKYTVASGYTVMKLLFLPNVEPEEGKYVYIDGEVWLSIYSDKKELAPHLYIQECNNSIEIEYLGEKYTYPCLTETRVRDTQKLNELVYIDLSLDSLKITLPYDEITSSIDYKDKFLIGNKSWETQGINSITKVKKGKGIVELAMKLVPLSEEQKKDIEVKKEKEKQSPIVIAEIVGEKDVLVQSNEQYTLLLYYDDRVIEPENVTWNSDKGFITSKGLFTAKCEVGSFYITAYVEYLDGCGDVKIIKATKEIKVYNERWSW